MSTRKHVAEQKRRRTQRNLVYVAVAAVLVVAAALAVALSRPDTPTSTATSTATEQVRPITTAGTPLPAYAPETSDPAIGMAIPTVSGTSFEGEPLRIADNGKAKVVMFVAHWCPHCRREVPLLANDLRQSPLPPNVEMITISTGVNVNAPNYPPSKWLADADWPTPVIVDDDQSSAAKAFGITGYPYLVFVDADGRVDYRSSGEMSVADFREHVAAIQK